jgi:hypothetical protein
MNPLNVFSDTVIASSGKHTNKQTNNTWMKLCATAKNEAVSLCATVLYKDNVRKFWY